MEDRLISERIKMDKDFLLQVYGQCYDPEAGPWNLSVENKYLEYMFAKFFEENFQIGAGANVCNIGIGAGYWDRYLSYKLNGGVLMSIDIDEIACRQLRECLINERNPNQVKIIHSDIMKADYLSHRFDIVTMVGSTRRESGLYEEIIKKAFSMLKVGGSLYYQSLDKNEKKDDFISLCQKSDMSVDRYLLDTNYGFFAQYWKATRR